MTKEELNIWIKSARYIGHERDWYDSCGNHEESRLYQKDDKYYIIDYQNNYPCGKWNGKGYIKDQFAGPREVTKKTRIVEEVFYE